MLYICAQIFVSPESLMEFTTQCIEPIIIKMAPPIEECDLTLKLKSNSVQEIYKLID